MKRKNTSTLRLTRGAVIAALYFIFTLISGIFGLSSGVIQFRISEAMCILPLFFPESVLGLFVGCMISNLILSGSIFDIIFGSLATLLGALGALLWKKLPRKIHPLAGIPTVIANAIIIPPVISYAFGATESIYFIALTVSIGEIVCAGVGGALLYYLLKRTPKLLK